MEFEQLGMAIRTKEWRFFNYCYADSKIKWLTGCCKNRNWLWEGKNLHTAYTQLN